MELRRNVKKTSFNEPSWHACSADPYSKFLRGLEISESIHVNKALHYIRMSDTQDFHLRYSHPITSTGLATTMPDKPYCHSELPPASRSLQFDHIQSYSWRYILCWLGIGGETIGEVRFPTPYLSRPSGVWLKHVEYIVTSYFLCIESIVSTHNSRSEVKNDNSK